MNSSRSPRIRVKEVSKILGCAVSTVWAWANKGYIPKPRRVGPKFSFWLRSEIDAVARGETLPSLASPRAHEDTGTQG